jgi:hypothetical protein
LASLPELTKKQTCNGEGKVPDSLRANSTMFGLMPVLAESKWSRAEEGGALEIAGVGVENLQLPLCRRDDSGVAMANCAHEMVVSSAGGKRGGSR